MREIFVRPSVPSPLPHKISSRRQLKFFFAPNVWYRRLVFCTFSVSVRVNCWIDNRISFKVSHKFCFSCPELTILLIERYDIRYLAFVFFVSLVRTYRRQPSFSWRSVSNSVITAWFQIFVCLKVFFLKVWHQINCN